MNGGLARLIEILVLAACGTAARCSSQVQGHVGIANHAILQIRENDCGLAALANVAMLTGRPVQLSELERQVDVPARGLSMLDIQRAAATIHIELYGVRTTVEGAARLQAPWIAHLNLGIGHFVVVTHVLDDRWLIIDPRSGERALFSSQVRTLWSGNALVIGGRRN
jgi:ABC-type bacteriocin/lantibiotic exporter with double-glycine peptidase domain